MSYGIPLIFDDKTGHFVSEFNEIHDRMWLKITFTTHAHGRGIYTVYNSQPSGERVYLEFMPNNALGTICIGSKGKPVPMDTFLCKMRSSTERQFLASDGQVYVWSWQAADNEWRCLNKNKYLVSSYSSKPPGEPAYSSSGSCFTVDENYDHIALELLGTLTIMRHILIYNI